MTVRKLLLIIAGLAFIAFHADAQSTITLRKRGDRFSGASTAKEREKMIGSTIDVNSMPIEYGKYSDDKLESLEKQMEERDWSSEDTAWKRARAEDTKESYRRYVAMYPYGAHRPDASSRLIDLDVNDIFNGDHDNLPGMKHVESDDDSPTSTITVENDTGYRLTVMYSGTESKSIQISPGCKGTVTLPNGQYRIAASVRAPHVRPYAGNQEFSGGRYETGYCIVSTWPGAF